MRASGSKIICTIDNEIHFNFNFFLKQFCEIEVAIN